MNIIVYDNNNINKNVIITDIICPICYESIKLYIEDYNIYLYECKNKHEIDNILINEFEEIQKIDISKIKCEKCKKKNKNETYNNQFYRCNSCKINICPLCKSNHDKKLINYSI